MLVYYQFKLVPICRSHFSYRTNPERNGSQPLSRQSTLKATGEKESFDISGYKKSKYDQWI
jgi:hypothetical protein